MLVKVLGGDIPGAPGGSGTLNTIPLWTPDGNTLGNSVLKQDVKLIKILVLVLHQKLVWLLILLN